MAIFPNIKVVEGNAFSVLVPLKVRTFESCRPIDEDIDPTQLDNVVFKFGGVSYTPVVDERGVSAVLPATLARGTYDIVVTADYDDNPIRAAYEGAVTIVPWNSQSDAQQYLPGSPIVLDAAYIIGGALTDAELEALKEELRLKIADAEAAEAAAEAAKEHYDELAEQLSGVAQQGTNADATNTAILAAIGQGGGGDARESTSQQILGIVQTTENDIQTIIPDLAQGKQALVQAVVDEGGQATMTMSLTQLAQAIYSIQYPTLLKISAITPINNSQYTVLDYGAIALYTGTTLAFTNYANLVEVRNLPDCPNVSSFNSMFNNCALLQKIDMHGFNFYGAGQYGLFLGCVSLTWVDVSDTKASGSKDLRSLLLYSINVQTLVGNKTYDEIVNNDVSIFKGFTDAPYGYQIGSATNLNQASLRAVINGLPDRVGETTRTLQMGTDNLNRLSAEDIAIATNKNWTLS